MEFLRKAMATTDEDLNQLEKDIRQLKIEYEQFFGGGRPRPPADTIWRIEQMIKRYAERGGQISFAQRFRYNNLAQTYAKYQEIFRKRLKEKEEGVVHRSFGAAARAVRAEREKAMAAKAAEAEAAEPAAETGAQRAPTPPEYAVVCSNPELESAKVQELYRVLVEAKQKAGEKTDSLTLDSFTQFVKQKTHQLKQQKGCEQVEYAVSLEDGQVKLKARVKA
jgi:hypothetical protein